MIRLFLIIPYLLHTKVNLKTHIEIDILLYDKKQISMLDKKHSFLIDFYIT